VTLVADLVYFNARFHQNLAKLEALALNCVVQGIAVWIVASEAVDSTPVKNVKDAVQMGELATWAVESEYVHQVLLLFILLLNDWVVRSLGQQSQHQLEFLFVKRILHSHHVVKLAVQNQVGKPLLLVLNGMSEAGLRLHLFFHRWL
jgi:hypothetical protein